MVKGIHLWRMKQDKSEIFEVQERAYEDYMQKKAIDDDRPLGFDRSEVPGMFYNKERNVYLDQATKQLLWLDEAAQAHQPFREGEDSGLSFAAGAAASLGSTATVPTPKQLIIPDLHAAAKAFKIDVAHLDRPAGVVAIFGSGADGTAPPDAAAKALPEKLLRRLAAFRGEWSDQMLAGSLARAFADVAFALGGRQPVAAVALASGPRVVAAATPGARFSIAADAPGVEPEALDAATAAPGLGEPTAARCRQLAEGGSTEALLVAMSLGEAGAGGLALLAAAAPHLSQGRPRAASFEVLRASCARGAEGPAAAAGARLGARFAGRAPGEAAAASSAAPPAKRPRQAEVSKIRLRQILLRHAASKSAVDPVRRKPVTRTLEEAEERLLTALNELSADGCASFAATCRAISECQSALKGGEFAGDLGWLDRPSQDAQKQKEAARPASAAAAKPTKPPVPASVLKVAFELGVGQLGDLVASEAGVHLVQRTA
ncbi:unnamed protein product [Prorocentrum cordatum]|uniref:peptidylprolyl isomerase n=1 Tax=Prorocentrum cordatum TaxID=2364126 RepID=A0ABN9VXN1_9DINO|nr:unnamed protein product [Polarella glacialis]